MEQAFVVFAGDGVLGISEIEDDSALLENDRVGSAAKKILERPDERFRSHRKILVVLP